MVIDGTDFGGRFVAKKFFSILIIIVIIWIGFKKYNSNFSSEKWIENPNKRVNIVDDLLNEYKFIGKSKSEVIKLLGTPTEQAYFKEVNNIVYYLGDERGFISIDSEWLVLDFDSLGKVTKYEIKTD